MRVSVLVPFYADITTPGGRQRDQVWAWCRRRWAELLRVHIVDELIIGHDPAAGDSPFSVARALNDAAKRATGDRWLLFGADHVADPVVCAWGASQLGRHPYVRLYDRIAYATEPATRLILHGSSTSGAIPLETADWHEASAPCPGVLGVTRAAFDAAGGLDERYEGWGYEDTAFLDMLHHTNPGPVHGRMRASGHTLRELFVPTERNLNGPNKSIYESGN